MGIFKGGQHSSMCQFLTGYLLTGLVYSFHIYSLPAWDWGGFERHMFFVFLLKISMKNLWVVISPLNKTFILDVVILL